ncbi:glycosyltransferase [Echinicola sp. 20G]|uniref:glycosyltransferase n=1 Tax=Echinicola sp. 20G TaxID=2781961 RepID=UPI00191097FB|nr:glycosyltransferase [Echinicola sp. 20G]
MNAPICLFTYNRLEETQKTVEALRANYLAGDSELYIFSDGWKSESGKEKVLGVRSYLKSIEGFKKVIIFESPQNQGLAKSIIGGVTKVLESHKRVIVLEDDLVTAPNFLNFMNQGLEFYEDDENVISVSGYTLDLPSLPGRGDYYFGLRASSWGWGTWRNRWEQIDWEVSDYEDFVKSTSLKKRFNRGGSDMCKMLSAQMNGRIDSWAIRFCYHQFKNGMVTVFPSSSKLYSVGFSSNATHTVETKRFETNLDQSNKKSYLFEKYQGVDDMLVKEFRMKFSIKARVLDKIGKILRK